MSMAQKAHELALHSMKNQYAQVLCIGVKYIKFHDCFATIKGVETLTVCFTIMTECS